jgi:DNA polymerase III alpha subunit
MKSIAVSCICEDEWGLLNVIVCPDVFQAQREAFAAANVLVVEGIVQRARGQVNLLAEKGWTVQ